MLDERQARQVRAQYGAKLTMIDHWFGRVLDALDRNGLWDDTAVIVCTDHGHYLGEKDIWGKPAVPIYEPLGHIPLMVAWPGVAAGDVRRAHDERRHLRDARRPVRRRARAPHARPVAAPAPQRRATRVREWALAGIWGREVHVVDAQTQVRPRAGRRERAAVDVVEPLVDDARPRALPTSRRVPPPDERADLDRMPGSKVPVIRQPFGAGDLLPFWAMTRFTGNHLYDRRDDPDEERNLAGTKREAEMAEKLRVALDRDRSPGRPVRPPRPLLAAR